MNAITQAFVAAGVKLPTQSERLWRVVKDHPGCHSTKAAKITGISEANTSSLLGAMARRDMLITSTTQMRVPGPRGSMITRAILTYTVHPRMNGEYEMLPAPLKSVSAKVVPIKEPSAVIKPEPPPAAPGIDIDHLTLSQARSLYGALHQLFGGRV